MAATYGIDFPFRDSLEGKFLKMTGSPEVEIRANLIHLLLTKRGSRYFLPEFGTNWSHFFSHNYIETRQFQISSLKNFLYLVALASVSFSKRVNVPRKVECRRTVKSALTFNL